MSFRLTGDVSRVSEAIRVIGSIGDVEEFEYPQVKMGTTGAARCDEWIFGDRKGQHTAEFLPTENTVLTDIHPTLPTTKWVEAPFCATGRDDPTVT